MRVTMRSTTLRRLRAALLLGVQLAGVAVPLADARLDGGYSATVHVEERADRSCNAVHFHDDCALCQQLTQRQLACPEGSVLPEPVWTRIVRADDAAVRPATARVLLERGRSPPTA